MSLHYNSDTIYIECGTSNEENLHKIVTEAIQKAKIILNYDNDIKCPYKLNIVRFTEKETGLPKSTGYAYLWIGDHRIYWILVGHNPDASERYIEYPDPNWKPLEINNNDSSELWADLILSSESNIQPMIKEKLKPLVTFSDFTYSDSQYEELKKRESEFGVITDNICRLKVSRARVKPVPSGKCGYILYSRSVPNWVSTELITTIFSRYVGNKSLKIQHIYDGKKSISNLPLIIRNNEHVYIVYDPNSHDTSFARLMQRKTLIQNPDNKSQSVELVFDYAYDKTNFNVKILNDKPSSNTMINRKCLYNGYDYIVSQFDPKHPELIQIKNVLTCELKWINYHNLDIY